MAPPSARSPAAGFTLVEVLIALALLTTVSIAVARLFAVAATAGAAARDQTSTVILASAKLEQLRSLTWAYDPSASSPIPRSDTTANLSVDPPDDSGPGLMASPAGTLTSSMPPFVDYLDLQGRWVGNGTAPPSGAVFIRRWSVQPLPQDPYRTLILTVRVTTVAAEARRDRSPWRARSGQETLLVGLKTRKGQ
jgi:prepilin-type N-terminal cleavage/methylation domain-containing protein